MKDFDPLQPLDVDQPAAVLEAHAEGGPVTRAVAAVIWLVFCIALAISPALVLAAWGALT